MAHIFVKGDEAERRSIWLPGRGEVPVHIRQVTQAVEEYDARLSLGRDKKDGNWVVLRSGGPDGIPDFPVFGLGPNLPSADRVKRMLAERDVTRNGAKIIKQVNQRQKQRRDAARNRANDATHEAAEALAWGSRQMGDINAPGKVFISKGV